MADARSRESSTDAQRPTGVVEPQEDRARRALIALREQRLDDAERHLARMPETTAPDQCWKRTLEGLLALGRGQAGKAMLCFQRAMGHAPPEPLATAADELESTPQHQDENTPPEACSFLLRTAAFAAELLGMTLRRQERLDEARRFHLLALKLRESVGSYEEQWESLRSLGIIAALGSRHEEALERHLRASDVARCCTVERARKRALCRSDASATLISLGRFEEAVEAAREALELWRSHDAGCVETARAQAALGFALLRKGQHHLENGAPEIACFEDARERLGEAVESFQAFGAPYNADADYCAQQIDFLDRLRAMRDLNQAAR